MMYVGVNYRIEKDLFIKENGGFCLVLCFYADKGEIIMDRDGEAGRGGWKK
jgi:hypothetical protein